MHMSTIFYLDKENKILLHSEAYKVLPELQILSETELRCVILATDYQSPFRLYPTKERRQNAVRWVYGKNSEKYLKDKKLLKAFENYNSIQYDQERETLRVLIDKKAMVENQMLLEENSNKIKGLVDTIKTLQGVIKEYETSITSTIQTNYVLKGGGKKSLLETLHENKRLYEIAQNNKFKVTYENNLKVKYKAEE